MNNTVCAKCDRAGYMVVAGDNGPEPRCDWHVTNRLPRAIRWRSFGPYCIKETADGYSRLMMPALGRSQAMLPEQPNCDGLLAGIEVHGHDPKSRGLRPDARCLFCHVPLVNAVCPECDEGYESQ